MMARLRQFLLFIHTIRYLKAEQAFFQIYYRLRPKVASTVKAVARKVYPLRSWTTYWSSPCYLEPSVLDYGEFCFLGRFGKIDRPAGWEWNNQHFDKLWLYNLHYFDDLNARDAKSRRATHRHLVERWIKDNPINSGNGWEPYPLSLRLVNLVKWLSSGVLSSSEEWTDHCLYSIQQQADVLSRKVERHILANHIFANGKALVFVGAFFGVNGDDWLDQGLAILDREIKEQFLNDGGHFELSPMYHSLLLWDLCDLIRLAQCSGIPELTDRSERWSVTLRKGLEWLRLMCHPDGEVSFFNDTTFGIAPTLEDLEGYVSFLGLDSGGEVDLALSSAGSDVSCWYLPDSGYACIELPKGKAILDLAEVGPSYQAGHAHADTLSFEMSLFGQRVLVNSGISRYGADSERLRQRGTAVHNTVIVDDTDSSEVWSGFRVARRAKPFNVSVEKNSSGLIVRGAHNGYKRLRRDLIHRRTWQFSHKQVEISDEVSGTHRVAYARYHFHPDLQVQLDSAITGTVVFEDDRKVYLEIQLGTATLEDTTWHPGFGKSRANKCLVVKLEDGAARLSISW